MKIITLRLESLLVVAMSALVCTLVTDAFAAVGSYPASAAEAISGALGNVRSRYKAKLSRYGLTESYFDETSGICDLMLLDVDSWTKFQIVYYRSTGLIEWPRSMPKSVAEDLMQDRLLIHAYESSLGREKSKTVGTKKNAAEGAAKSQPRKRPKPKLKPKPLHQEYVPTPEERDAIARVDAASKELKKAQQEVKNKPTLAQQSDFRQMAELKRKGMSGDEIASRFGIDRVKEYNKAHPNNLIRTSKHSKPGVPGFTW